MSVPSFKISAFPFFISRSVFISILSSPPLGYLITTGLFKLTANSNICSNSLKFLGAIIVKLGTSLKNDISNSP